MMVSNVRTLDCPDVHDFLPDHSCPPTGGLVQGWESVCCGVAGIPSVESKIRFKRYYWSHITKWPFHVFVIDIYTIFKTFILLKLHNVPFMFSWRYSSHMTYLPFHGLDRYWSRITKLPFHAFCERCWSHMQDKKKTDRQDCPGPAFSKLFKVVACKDFEVSKMRLSKNDPGFSWLLGILVVIV